MTSFSMTYVYVHRRFDLEYQVSALAAGVQDARAHSRALPATRSRRS